MAHLSNTEFQSLNIAVLTVSDTRDIDSDTSGQALIDGLTNAGHSLAERAIVKDDIWQIRARVCSWIASENVQVVLITGGTGFTARDNTPQAVQPLRDKSVDGVGELFRHFSLGEIGTSTVQSRALAGMSNGTLVCCQPGSTNACRTAGNKILVEQLDSRTKPCNFVPHLKASAVAYCGPRS